MPRSVRSGETELYDRHYYEMCDGGRSLAGGKEEASSKLRARLASMERRLGWPGRLVDVGCATGVFVAYAKGRGWDAIGVEPSAWAAEQGRRTRGVEIVTGTLEDAMLEPGSFDVVHSNHVVEHLDDPVRTLSVASRLLKQSGVLVIEVPYELTLPLAERTLAMVGTNQTRPDTTYHLSFFSKHGLEEVAKRSGLRVESIVGQPREPVSGSGAKALVLNALYAVEARSPRPNALVMTAVAV
jgi:SAM-dependent methyltransferase